MITPVSAVFPADWRCSVTVSRRAGTDRLGNELPPRVFTIDDCLVAQRSTDDPVDLSQQVNTAVVLYAPPGVDLVNGDEVEPQPGYFVSGRHVVVGDPARGPLGVSAELRRASRGKR